MPTYSYQCTNHFCLSKADVFHRINENPEVECEICGAPMQRLVSSAPFVFKQKRGTFGVSTGGKAEEPLS